MFFVDKVRLPGLPITIFRIWYSSSYTLVLLLTFAISAISPIVQAVQLIKLRRIPDALALSILFVSTFLIAIAIYLNRIYTTRATLSAIPKARLPLDDSDVGSSVRRVLEHHWSRCALLAWEATPRKWSPDDASVIQQPQFMNAVGQKPPNRLRRLLTGRIGSRPSSARPVVAPEPVSAPGQTESATPGLPPRQHPPAQDGSAIRLTMEPLRLPKQSTPPWGVISHPGWLGEEDADFDGNVEFATIIAGLPVSIEEKLVQQAEDVASMLFGTVMISRAQLEPAPAHHKAPGTVGQSVRLNLAPTAPPQTPSLVVPSLPSSLDQLEMDDESGTGLLSVGSDPVMLVKSILERPGHLSLRSYLTGMVDLGLVQPAVAADNFIVQYDLARFSPSGHAVVTTEMFKSLANACAVLIEAISPDNVDVELLVDVLGLRIGDGDEYEVSRPKTSPTETVTNVRTERPGRQVSASHFGHDGHDSHDSNGADGESVNESVSAFDGPRQRPGSGSSSSRASQKTTIHHHRQGQLSQSSRPSPRAGFGDARLSSLVLEQDGAGAAQPYDGPDTMAQLNSDISLVTDPGDGRAGLSRLARPFQIRRRHSGSSGSSGNSVATVQRRDPDLPPPVALGVSTDGRDGSDRSDRVGRAMGEQTTRSGLLSPLTRFLSRRSSNGGSVPPSPD